MFIGYYHGLGIIDAPGILGKNYYKIRVITTDRRDGYCFISFVGEGYNYFIDRYPDGTIQATGQCMVEIQHTYPFPDTNDVDSAKCYKPGGSLGSSVVNGTGIQTYWTFDGIKIWELELEVNKRKKLIVWNRDGTLRFVHQDGEYEYFNRD